MLFFIIVDLVSPKQLKIQLSTVSSSRIMDVNVFWANRDHEYL